MIDAVLRFIEEIKKITKEVKEDFCDNYCKYPSEWNPEDGELSESDICRNCPLNRL